MAVNVFFTVKIPAEAEKKIPLLKGAAAEALGPKFERGSVNLIYTGAAGIKRLNIKYLKRDRVTDVIAFSYPPARVSGAVLGEIYICLPQAKKQAAEMGHGFLTEILTLTVHGSLHLKGMDDSTPELRAAMNRKTTAVLKKTAPKNIPNW